jgi:hypothetical protein
MDEKDPFAVTCFNHEQSLQIKLQCSLGRRQYDDLRITLLPGIELRSSYCLRNLTKILMPQMRPYMDGVRVPFKEAITKTIERRLEICDYTGFDFVGGCMTAKVAVGFDGSGSHNQRRGNDIKINTR